MSERAINLLPPERRRRLRNESMAASLTDIVRSVNDGLWLMSLIGVAIVAAMWLFSWAAKQTTAADLLQAVDRYQVLRNAVAEENAVLEHVAALSQQRIVWSQFLGDFFALTPTGISLNRLSGDLTFVNGIVDSGVLTFGGQAATRSTLVVYQERLQGMTGVREVKSPTSNLLERNNPSFQFSVMLGSK